MSWCALLINYNTAAQTLRCVESLCVATAAPAVLVLDNASAPDDRQRLRAGLERFGAAVRLIASEHNLGFAEGCNRLIAEALQDAAMSHVLLINNDAWLLPEGMAVLEDALTQLHPDLFGARMHRWCEGVDAGVDALGIAVYRSLLASNRKHLDERFLGPTGGLALLSRHLLEALQRTHGYVFDPDYFCYAEDTDLCLRARLLGFDAHYDDRLVAYHEGQASSGGSYSDFVYYHGIRNSIWTQVKCMPAGRVLRSLPWVLALHAGIVLRHLLRGKLGITVRLYRDAIRGLPACWRKRRVIQASRVSAVALDPFITPRFYEPEYVRQALRALWPLGARRS